MGTIVSQITSLTIVYSIVYSDADHRKHQNSASLAFVRGIHRGPVNAPHKWPVTRKMFPFDDVIMIDIFDNEVIQKDGRWQSYENVFNPHNKTMHNKILVKFSGRNRKDADYHQRTSSETWIVNCRVSIKHGPVYQYMAFHTILITVHNRPDFELKSAGYRWIPFTKGRQYVALVLLCC